MNGADLACEIANIPGIFSGLNLSSCSCWQRREAASGAFDSIQLALRILGLGRQMNGSGSSSHEPFT